MDRINDGFNAMVSFSSEPIFKGPLRPHSIAQALDQRDPLNSLSHLAQASFQECDLLAELELLFRVVPEECVWHVVIRAKLCARIG